jgi:hypothetical protein
MPLRRKTNKKRNKNKSGSMSLAGTNPSSRTIVRENGTGLLIFGIANTQSSTALAVAPQSFSTDIPRFAELMEAYQLFRFTSMKLKILPQDFGAAFTGDYWTLAYSQGEPTATSTLAPATIAVFPCSVTMSNTMTVPQTLNVNRPQLITDGPNKWYRTQPNASVESWEEQQGELIWAVSGLVSTTQQLIVQLQYSIELTAPIAPTMIPKPPLSSACLDFICTEVSKRQLTAYTSK